MYISNSSTLLCADSKVLRHTGNNTAAVSKYHACCEVSASHSMNMETFYTLERDAVSPVCKQRRSKKHADSIHTVSAMSVQ